MSIEKLFIENDCYYMKGKRKNKRITNFILIDPKPIYGDTKVGDIKRMVGCTVDIQQRGDRIAKVEIPEDAWARPSLFKRSISGISDLIFLGDGNTLQIIKYWLFHQIETE